MNNNAVFATKQRGQSTARISQAQRNEIMRLLRLAEFDTRTVTFQHRRLGVSEHEIGKPVDAWLDTLTLGTVSPVITTLRNIVGAEDDDE